MSAPIADFIREANFQSAWYYSMLLFVVVCLVIGGAVVVQNVVRPMWRAGEKALAVLVASVAATTSVFFAFMLAITAYGLLTRAFGG